MQVAARIAGCSDRTIARAVAAGHIKRRETTSRAVPSLDRVTVEAYATQRRAEQAARARDKAVGEQDRDRRRSTLRPPDDGNVWLTPTEAALVLGLSPSRVKQMTRQDRLPHHTTPAGRHFFRRDHIEQVAAARRHRHPFHSPRSTQ
jgi:excisionase family DNA binding protein